MLFYHKYIPMEARRPMMTVAKMPCECCTPDVAIVQLQQGREQMRELRKFYVLDNADKFGAHFTFDKFDPATSDPKKVDSDYFLSPSLADMWQHLRYLNVKMTTNLPFAEKIADSLGTMIYEEMERRAKQEESESNGVLPTAGKERHVSKVETPPPPPTDEAELQ